MTETRYIFRWQGAEDTASYTLQEAEDQLHGECMELVDLCEQEILEGGHWDDSPANENRRTQERDSLWEVSILRQWQTVLHEGGGAVEFRPRYAIAQRENYTVYIEVEEVQV